MSASEVQLNSVLKRRNRRLMLILLAAIPVVLAVVWWRYDFVRLNVLRAYLFGPWGGNVYGGDFRLAGRPTMVYISGSSEIHVESDSTLISKPIWFSYDRIWETPSPTAMEWRGHGIYRQNDFPRSFQIRSYTYYNTEAKLAIGLSLNDNVGFGENFDGMKSQALEITVYIGPHNFGDRVVFFVGVDSGEDQLQSPYLRRNGLPNKVLDVDSFRAAVSNLPVDVLTELQSLLVGSRYQEWLPATVEE